jgi:hypothetical protein
MMTVVSDDGLLRKTLAAEAQARVCVHSLPEPSARTFATCCTMEIIRE